MRRLYNIFIYVSLGFVLIYLLWNDYLFIPDIQSPLWLLISIFFMFGGFLLNAYAWQFLLKVNNVKISYIEALASTGLSIFGKYIPGKLWAIVGRAAYITNNHDQSMLRISGISLLGQFLAITTGILLGGQFFWHYSIKLGFGMFIAAVILLLIILSPSTDFILKRSMLYRYKKVRSALQLFGFQLIKVLPWYFLFWLCWGVGFYALSIALSGEIEAWSVVPAFILAGSIGIVVFFVPGGIGIREGALFFFLIKSNLSSEIAATIAVASRLWFLVGESFIFTCGVIANQHLKKRK